MTKKSAARLARDAQRAAQKEHLETNTCWTDLEKLYCQCVGLLSSHTAIQALSKDKDLHRYLDQPESTSARIRSLASDLKAMSIELTQIHSQHEGKSGTEKDPDEWMRAAHIGEQYTLFMERHDGVLMPTVYEILEQFNQAEIKRIRANMPTDADRAQDPTDTSVIDVVARAPATIQ